MSARLIGKILVYSSDAQGGVLVAVDGKKYIFEKREWSAARLPMAGESVTFLTNLGHAYDVRMFGVSRSEDYVERIVGT